MLQPKWSLMSRREHTSLLSSQNCTGGQLPLTLVTDVCLQNNHWLCSLLPKLITSDLCAAQKLALCKRMSSRRGTKSLSQTFTMTVHCWWNDPPNSTRAAEFVATFKKRLYASFSSGLDPVILTLSLLFNFFFLSN